MVVWALGIYTTVSAPPVSRDAAVDTNGREKATRQSTHHPPTALTLTSTAAADGCPDTDRVRAAPGPSCAAPPIIGAIRKRAAEAAACASLLSKSSRLRGQRRALGSTRPASHLVATSACNHQPMLSSPSPNSVVPTGGGESKVMISGIACEELRD